MIEAVIKTYSLLNPKTLSGWDRISNMLLNIMLPSIATQLTHCFNYSFIEGFFPQQLNIAKVIPIYKLGDMLDLKNISSSIIA